jgi:hypothetical protein
MLFVWWYSLWRETLTLPLWLRLSDPLSHPLHSLPEIRKLCRHTTSAVHIKFTRSQEPLSMLDPICYTNCYIQMLFAQETWRPFQQFCCNSNGKCRLRQTAFDTWASSHETPRLFAGWLRIVCVHVSGLAVPCKSHTHKRFYAGTYKLLARYTVMPTEPPHVNSYTSGVSCLSGNTFTISKIQY